MKKIFIFALVVCTLQAMKPSITQQDKLYGTRTYYGKQLFFQGDMAATISYEIHANSSSHYEGYIKRLDVLERYRRKGFGQLLVIYTLQEMHKIANRLGFSVSAETSVANFPAFSLFKKLGFHIDSFHDSSPLLLYNSETMQRLLQIQKDIESRHNQKDISSSNSK